MARYGGEEFAFIFPDTDQQGADVLLSQLLKNIENFIAEIWYFKTIISHSVRTSEDCIYAVNSDVTIYTSLLESRLIIGDKKLYNNLKKDIDNKNIWTKKPTIKIR